MVMLLKNIIYIFLLVLAAQLVAADCVDLDNNETFGNLLHVSSGIYYIDRPLTLCTKTYNLDTYLVISGFDDVLDCNGATIHGGTMPSQKMGIYVGRQSPNLPSYEPRITVKNCNFQNLHTGMVLGKIRIANIINNTFDTCVKAVYFDGSNFINFSGNTVRNCDYGIDLTSALMYSSSSTYNTIADNTISSNKKGIRIQYAINNTITRNNIIDNEKGIYAEYGGNNIIYDNFLNNTVNAYVFPDIKNYWSIEKTEGTNINGGPYIAGNYWSDYSGTDSDRDGIGDTYYSTGGYGPDTDAQPLYVPANDLSETEETTIQTSFWGRIKGIFTRTPGKAVSENVNQIAAQESRGNCTGYIEKIIQLEKKIAELERKIKSLEQKKETTETKLAEKRYAPAAPQASNTESEEEQEERETELPELKQVVTKTLTIEQEQPEEEETEETAPTTLTTAPTTTVQAVQTTPVTTTVVNTNITTTTTLATMPKLTIPTRR